MKLFLTLLLVGSTFAVRAQDSAGATAYSRYEADIKSLTRCLSRDEAAQFRRYLTAWFDKDPAYSDEFAPGGFEGGGCFNARGGKLVQLSHNFGTLTSVTMHFFLVREGGVQVVDLDLSTTPLPAGVQRLSRPRISGVVRDLVTITTEGFREGDGDCCPGYSVTAQYVLRGNKLAFLREVVARKAEN